MKLRRCAALFGAMVLTFGLAGTVSADSGNPADIHAQVTGNTVTVSGDWAWDKCNGKKIVGWAVAWGDPGWTSNPVPKAEGGGSYYMGDAAQGNEVFTTGDPCEGTSGPLPGTLSHTYAEPGTYDVCVIVYDIQKDKDGGYPTGKHGVLAGGPDRNVDNSVEENDLEGVSICMSPDIPIVIETHPKISITKDADPEALPAGGGEVTYTYVVKNAGDVLLTDIEVWDDNGTASESDDWKVACPKDELAAGASMTCEVDKDIDETTTNIGTATGHDGDDEVLDADDATVTVAPPAVGPRIYILKTPSVTSLPAAGGPVTYTYLVWNVGSEPLTDVTVTDNKCSPISGPTGDTGADKILGLTETWTYTCTMTLTATTTNVGTATGWADDVKTIDAAEATVTVGSGGGVAGETSTTTAPPTDTVVPTTTDAGGTLPVLLILLGIIGLGAVVLTPSRVKR